MMGANWPVVASARQSIARRPRAFARVEGRTCSIVEFTVESKRHKAADTFTLYLEPFRQPEGFDLAYWADRAPGGATVEILAGMLDPGADAASLPTSPTSLILGQADEMDCDPLTGVLTITGRDLTARLTDGKTSSRWPQHTSSQIVTQLAGEAGLAVQAAATTVPAGEYYRTAYSQLARSMTRWDLVAFLAEREGFHAYVKGSTLYFQPPQTDDAAGPLSVVIGRNVDGVVQSNAAALKLHRKLVLAQAISIDVLSHHTSTGKAIKANATRAARRGGAGQLGYTISKPNRSQQQAQQHAENLLGELAQHEFGITVSMDGDLTMTADRPVRLSGSGTSFDTLYEVLTMTWHYKGETGLEMSFGAKLAAAAKNAGTATPLLPAGVTTGSIVEQGAT